MQMRGIATVAVLAIGASLAASTELYAQSTSIQTLLSTTVALPGPNTSQNITVDLVAGNTYYFQACANLPFNNKNDSEITLISPTGVQIAVNDDWLWSGPSATGISFPTGELPSPPNCWSSFIGYTPTASGAYTLKVTSYPATGVMPNPYPVVVSYKGNAPQPSPTPTPPAPSGIPNVQMEIPEGPLDLPTLPLLTASVRNEVTITSLPTGRRV